MKKRILETTVFLIILGLTGYLLFNLDSTKRPAAEIENQPAMDAAPKGSPTVSATGQPGASDFTAPAGVSAVPADSSKKISMPSIAPAPAPMEISSLPPATVLDNARVAIKNYSDRFGENPVGTNPEITAALLGKNPKGVTFFTPETGLRVDDQGAMVDAWGTPFFFHQLSGKLMEIRSAGEDRKMWTFDDQVTR